MGTLNCPLCCGETFPSQESLKYHLLSVTDNLYCPDCDTRFDSIPLLAQHLNGFCGKDFEEDMDTKENIIDNLQQVDTRHIVIVQNENNEMNTVTLDEGISEEHESTNINNNLPDSSITVCVGHNIKNDDDVECDPIELKITESLEVDQDFNENGEQYSCSICDMTFSSVMEHIKTYHDGQQVIIKVPEGENNKAIFDDDDDVLNELKCDDSPLIEMDPLEEDVDEEEEEEDDEDEEENIEKIQEYMESEGLVEFKNKDNDEEDEKDEERDNPGKNADIIGTIKQEHCLDQNGILYERKVVQIQKFWEKDQPNENNLNPLTNVGRKKERKKRKTLPEGLIKIIGGPEAATDDQTIERLLMEALETNPSVFESDDCPLEVKYLIDQEGGSKISIYICKLCKTEHESISKFLMHEYTCAAKGLNCDECVMVFNSLRAFKTHKAKIHMDKSEKKIYTKKILEEPVVCEFCDTPFWTIRSLKMHKRMHLPEETPRGIEPVSYKCTICNTICKTKRTLTQHQRIHEKNLTEIEKPELLEEAGINLLSSSVAVCPICADSFETDEKLSEHWVNSHSDMADADIGDPSKFICQICGEKVYRQFQDVHMAEHCTTTKFNCEICNRSFDTLNLLELHKRIHLDDKPFKCDVCKEHFTDMELLREHRQNHTNERPYSCNYCGRAFKRPHEKVKHERIHTGEKPHVCSVCGMRFRVKYCLTLHMRTHSGVRPYQCEFCDKRFRSHNGYSQHIKIHSDERSFKCPFCPKSFKTIVQLAGHKNTHTKPYSCSVCNRPFASLYSMRTHMASHGVDGRKDSLKFSCEICGASYARSFALRDHMKSVHDKNFIPTQTNSRIKYQEDFESD